MYRILDTLHLRSSWIHRYPHLAARGPGCLVLLAPEDITVRPALQGQSVTLHLPDGTTQVLSVSDTEINPDHIVALFFRDRLPEHFPRGAFFTWEE